MFYPFAKWSGDGKLNDGKFSLIELLMKDLPDLYFWQKGHSFQLALG